MKQFVEVIVLIFVVSCVLGVGLSLTMSQIMAPLRRIRPVALSLIANFIVVPALAVVITKSMALSESTSIGLILLGAAAGAPFLPRIVGIAKGDLAFAAALMVLLMIASLAYLPLVLPLLLPGVSVNSWQIARSLLITMIAPLGVGLCIRAHRESLAVRLRPLLSRLSNICLITALVLIPVMNSQRLLDMVCTRAIPAAVLFIIASFVVGYLAGGRKAEDRHVLGFATAARNIPSALLVGGQNFDDPNVAMMVIVVALLSLILLAPLAIAFGRQFPVDQKSQS